MSSFTDPLVVTPTGSGQKWKLVNRFAYYLRDADPNGPYIAVPAGFTTDFASVPRFLWSIFPPWDPEYGKAAIIHDWLLTKGCIFYPSAGRISTRRPDRAEADRIFLEAMRVLGCHRWKRYTMYAGVRLYSKLAGHDGGRG